MCLLFKAKKENKDSDNLIHQGIASRSVVRKFTLSEYIKVDSADFKDGILNIKLFEEIPEEKKAKDNKNKITSRGPRVEARVEALGLTL